MLRRGMPNVVVTRVPSSGPPKRSRSLDERLLARFPALYQRLAVITRRLSPGSRLRRALLRRASSSGWAAFNRRDVDLMLIRYAPDVEFDFSPGLRPLGWTGRIAGARRCSAGCAS